MAKFFRQVRYTILNKKNIQTYLLYALAEISLVMIGILLAMQVNDWSEEKKRDEQLHVIYKAVASDLRHDVTEAKNTQQLLAEHKHYYENILNNKVTKEMYANNKNYSHILLRHLYYSTNKRGFNLLQNHLITSYNQNDTLGNYIVQFYAKNIHRLERVKEMMDKEHDHVLQKWADNYAWFYTLNDKKLSNDYIHFLTYDPRFKNDVLTRKNRIYLNFVPTLEAYEKGAEEIVAAIEKKLNAE